MAGQTISVSVLADTRNFSSAMQSLGNETGFTKLTDGAKNLGKALAIGTAAVAGATLAWAATSVKSLARIEQIAAQTDAAITSTGGAAGRTREQIDALAGSIEDMSGVEAESITQGQNLLLTFTNIKGTSFDRATTTMTDMAVALNKGSLEGLDMSATATQLGKALNDPVKGISALSKVGVTFTEDQKTMIQSMVDAGDAAGAQTVILDELAKEFGGSAEAAGGTTLGKWERVKHMFGTIGETVFASLLPAVSSLTSWLLEKGMPLFDSFTQTLSDKVVPALVGLGAWFKDEGLPKLKEFGGWIADNVVPAIQSMGTWITGTLVPALKSFSTWVVDNKDWLAALAITIGTAVLGYMAYVKVMAIWQAAILVGTAAQAAFNAVMSANPIGIIILAVAALVAGLVYFFTQTDTGKAIITAAWAGIQTAISAVTDWWTGTALPALSAGWDAIVGFFSAGKDKVVAFMNATWDIIKLVWSYTPYGLIIGNWNAITGFFAGIPGKIQGYFSSAVTLLSTAGSNVMSGLKTGLSTGWTAVSTFVTGIPASIVTAIGTLGTTLYQKGKDVIQGFLNGAGSLLSTVGTFFLNKLPDWIKEPFKAAMGIASPSKLFKEYGQNTIQGLQLGLSDVGGLRQTMKGVSDVVMQGMDAELEVAATTRHVVAAPQTQAQAAQPIVVSLAGAQMTLMMDGRAVNAYVTEIADVRATMVLDDDKRARSNYRGHT